MLTDFFPFRLMKLLNSATGKNGGSSTLMRPTCHWMEVMEGMAEDWQQAILCPEPVVQGLLQTKQVFHQL
jgi:hypothetical protein